MNEVCAHIDGEPIELIAGDPSTFPSDAELARTLVATRTEATLHTLGNKAFPHAGVVSYAVGDDGKPIILISELDEHAVNARRNRWAVLLVTAESSDGGGLPKLAQIALSGCVKVLEEPHEARTCYLDCHPDSYRYADCSDFNFWQLSVEQCDLTSEPGQRTGVPAAAYAAASVDPIQRVAVSILEHMNQDHSDANLAYARHLAGLTEAIDAEMMGIDRYGVTLRTNSLAGVRMARVPFGDVLSDPAQARPAVIELLERARSVGAP
ncbi:MAG: DUF2470 domain-containing protein [Acidimicrobiales bacterium]|nr:DUF2470 domain-containing protein [Acidimicrobiales bacterium]